MTQRVSHVVLTGHSRGLGAAVARCALRMGATVLGLSRQACTDLPAEHGERLWQVPLDLADPAAVQAWLATGALHGWLATAQRAVLVNNAGTVIPMGPVGGLKPPCLQPTPDSEAAAHRLATAQALADAVALNVTTPLMLTDAFVAATAQCADRRVLHVSSGAGRSAYPGWSTYCASKAALDMHARVAQLDAVPGLRVASVAPGVIDTDMQADIRRTSAAEFPMQARFVALQQAGQLANANEVAKRLMAYVCADAFGHDPTPDLRQLPT